MLAAGTALSRYRIVRFIGKGGMGEAYLAEDTHLRRKVAIKIIAPQADPRKLAEALRLFQREMQAIARLDHPQPRSFQYAPRTGQSITENRQNVSTPAQNILGRFTFKPFSRRTIIILAVLVIFVIVSSGIFYVYQNQIINPNQYPSYLPGSGTLALSDALDGTNNQYHWDTTNSCSFSNGAYHIVSSDPNTLQNCVAASTNYTNFAFEVTMIINQGDCGGMVFRATSSTTNYYSLQVCQSGFYALLSNADNTFTNTQAIVTGNNSALKQSNIIDVLVNGNQIAIYINQQLTNSVRDSTYGHGEIGLLARSETISSTDVSYTNAKVWTL